jgi:hypothetical protein
MRLRTRRTCAADHRPPPVRKSQEEWLTGGLTLLRKQDQRRGGCGDSLPCNGCRPESCGGNLRVVLVDLNANAAATKLLSGDQRRS